jgi:hypothetical protein
MNARMRWFLFVLPLCLSACSFDFTELPRNTPATFSVFFNSNDESDSLSVYSVLNPGRDADGTSHAVTSHLVVFGQPITPVLSTYQAKWSLSGQLQDATSLTFLFPVVAEIAAGPNTAEVSLPRRIGGQSLPVRNGEAIVLPLRHSIQPEVSVQWRLDVLDSLGARRVSVTSESRLPEQIVIPRAWLPAPASARYEVRLDIIQGFRSAFAQDKYKYLISLQSILNWTLVIEP